MYRAELLVVALKLVSRSMSTSLILARMMLSPDGSTTCPERVAVSSWAKAEFAANRTINNRRQRCPTTRQEKRSTVLFLYKRMRGDRRLLPNKKCLWR